MLPCKSCFFWGTILIVYIRIIFLFAFLHSSNDAGNVVLAPATNHSVISHGDIYVSGSRLVSESALDAKISAMGNSASFTRYICQHDGSGTFKSVGDAGFYGFSAQECGGTLPSGDCDGFIGGFEANGDEFQPIVVLPGEYIRSSHTDFIGPGVDFTFKSGTGNVGPTRIYYYCYKHSSETTVSSYSGEPVLSCKDLPSSSPTGLYTLEYPSGLYRTHCEQSIDNGGWTLVAVVSDDGQDTWTWQSWTFWATSLSVFGSPLQLTRDFRSPALLNVDYTDILFTHRPSNVWAAYHNVGFGNSSLGNFVENFMGGGGVCYGTSGFSGFSLSDGNISVAGNLCDTNLYFNAVDQDGTSVCTGLNSDSTRGPNWNTQNNHGCPFDEPATGGLGPSASTSESQEKENSALGFGGPLGLNTGAPGSGENNMRVYVR